VRKTDIAKQGLMRISEVAKAAGVSLPTIHYYTREGLLFPSLKTAHNMAYYSQDCVKYIQLIKELQSKRFLPLSVIKLILRAKREGQDTEHIVEMRSFMEGVFQPLENEAKPRDISFSELVAATGLPESMLKALEVKGLIVPVKTKHGLTYDDIDIRIGKIFRKLSELGLAPDDLDVYRQYIEIIRIEAKAMHEIVHRLLYHGKTPVKELYQALNDFKGSLAMRIYRQEVQLSHESGLHQEEKE